MNYQGVVELFRNSISRTDTTFEVISGITQPVSVSGDGATDFRFRYFLENISYETEEADALRRSDVTIVPIASWNFSATFDRMRKDDSDEGHVAFVDAANGIARQITMMTSSDRNLLRTIVSSLSFVNNREDEKKTSVAIFDFLIETRID